MKLSRCVIIYRAHLLGVLGRAKTGGAVKGLQAVAASMNTHHANSTVIYGESCQSRGQATFTHSYQRMISADRDFCITSIFAPGPRPDCVFACVQVCLCVLRREAGDDQRSIVGCIPCVCLSFGADLL